MLRKDRLLIITGCCLLMVAVSIPANCMGIFLKHVSTSLDISYSSLSLYITIQYITMIIVLPVAGKVMAGGYMKKAMLLAVLCIVLALCLMGTAQSLNSFYIAGVAIGIGQAFLLFLPVPLLINAWFNKNNGTFIGMAYMFLSIGAAVLSPVGGYIIQYHGWREAYLIFACIVLAALPVIFFMLKPADRDNAKQGNEKALSGLHFPSAARTPGFYMAFLFAGILGLLPTLVIHLPTYASSIELTPVLGAGVLSAALFGGGMGKLLSGVINDRLGAGQAAAVSMCAGAAGLLLLLFVREYYLVLVAGFLFGLGYSSAVVLPPLLTRTLFGAADYSRIYSVIMTASSLGSACGAWLYGYLYSSTGGFREIFMGTAVLMLFAAVLCIGAIKSSRLQAV